MNINAKWISAFKNNDPINPDLSGVRKDIYEGYDPNKLPMDTKAFQFAKDFTIKKKIMSAELMVSACGYIQAYINGFRMGREVLSPSFSDYSKVIYYSTYDVTNFLSENNRIGLLVGNGFYNIFEKDTWKIDEAHWRGQSKAIACLCLQYIDGTSENIITDDSWKYCESAIQYQNLRSGEYHDMNLYNKNWNRIDFDISNWENVYVHGNPNFGKSDNFPLENPLAPTGILKREIIKPIHKFRGHDNDTKIVSIEKIGEKETLITLDQNTVGWAKFHIHGKKDDIIKFEFIEYNDNKKLDIFTTNTFQTFEVKLSGNDEYCEPKFSYYGFQYIKIYGDYTPTEDDIVLYCVHNHFQSDNIFFCDNETINKIHDMCRRTYILNWQSIPTDCPQREKNGWSADGWLAAEMGLINYKCSSGYKKWLNDMVYNWEVFKEMSPIVPNANWWNCHKEGKEFDPIWGGAMIMICKYLYKYTQDIKVLETYYPYMKDYIDSLENNTHNELYLEENGTSLGDWCDWERDKNYQSIYTDHYLASNMMIYILLLNICEFAKILGKEEDVKYYNSLMTIKDKINNKWFDYENNYYMENSMTAQALGLYFNIIPEENYKKATEHFINTIDKFNNKINCGIVGNWIIYDTLSKLGYKEKVLDILLDDKAPGFAYMLKEGATTLWETWNGDSSHNHPMFGTIDAWIQKNIGGLDYVDGEFVFTVPDLKKINKAKVSLKSNKGNVICSWEKTDTNYNILVESPEEVVVKLKFDSIPNYEEEIVSEERTKVKVEY